MGGPGGNVHSATASPPGTFCVPLLRGSPKQQLLRNVLDFAIPWVKKVTRAPPSAADGSLFSQHRTPKIQPR